MVHRSIATLAAVFAATLVVTGVAASTAAPGDTVSGPPAPGLDAFDHRTSRRVLAADRSLD